MRVEKKKKRHFSLPRSFIGQESCLRESEIGGNCISLLESLGTGSSAWLAVPFCPQSLTASCVQRSRVHGHLSALTQGSITPLLPTVSCGRTPWCMSEPGCPVTDVPLRFPCPPCPALPLFPNFGSLARSAARAPRALCWRLRVRPRPPAGR